MEKPANFTRWDRENIGLLLNAKIQGGKWKCDHFPDVKSGAQWDMVVIFSRIGWTAFSFSPCTVWLVSVMDANTNGIAYLLFSFSLSGRLLHWDARDTFATSKGHSNFYHTPFRGAEPGRRGKNKIKATFKNNKKWGLCHFRESKWVVGLRCYAALVWSQLLLSPFLPPTPPNPPLPPCSPFSSRIFSSLFCGCQPMSWRWPFLTTHPVGL